MLHPTLAADTYPVTILPLCEVRLMNQAAFPWLILVPQRANITEITELTEADKQQLMREISHVGAALKSLTHAHKLNIAALGNIVPQLHVHVIARFTDDAAWPSPVWGHPITPYRNESIATFIDQIREVLTDPLTADR